MRVILGLVLSVIFATGASAQWAYQEKQASAFSNETVHLLGTTKQGKVLGFRCKNGVSKIMYLLASKADEGEIDMANVLHPKLYVRIDNNQPHELFSVARDTNGQLAFLGDVDTTVIE